MTKILILIIMLYFSGELLAQHDHHNMDNTAGDTMMVVDSTIDKKHDHNMQNMNMDKDKDMEDELSMTHAYSLSLPMNRNGSGTGWLPDNSLMFGYMLHSGNWMFMFHGSVFLRYTSTDINKEGSFGSSMWDAPNWFMAMAQRKISANGLLKFSLMMSLDRFTEGGDGYPLLFQSGETWQGKPLVNRQHPHDLFSELSIAYTQKLNRNIDITGYFGYPGEPALGPVAFMHRVSSSNNPDAPLSHHWQDASHITFGVATLGLRYGILKLEGSAFNGSEPDENRYNFDKPKFTSYSYRLSISPDKSLVAQFSQGFIKSPEELEPGVDVTRTTASVIHSYSFSKLLNINSTIAWGMNDKGEHHKEHSLLLESNLQKNKLNVYGRYEFVQKDPNELQLEKYDHDKIFGINALTLGTNYRLAQVNNTDVSLGLQASVYFTPGELQPVYGKNPFSAQVYLKISPSEMTMGPDHSNNNSKHKH